MRKYTVVKVMKSAFHWAMLTSWITVVVIVVLGGMILLALYRIMPEQQSQSLSALWQTATRWIVPLQAPPPPMTPPPQRTEAEEAIPVMQFSVEEPPIVSEEQIAMMKSELANAPQEPLLQQIAGSLTMDQAIRWSKTLEGGLTLSELTFLSEQLRTMLPPEQYEQVLRILLQHVLKDE